MVRATRCATTKLSPCHEAVVVSPHAQTSTSPHSPPDATQQSLPASSPMTPVQQALLDYERTRDRQQLLDSLKAQAKKVNK